MPTLKPATPLPWFNDDEIIMPSLESAPFDDSAYDRSAQAWVADCRNGNGKAKGIIYLNPLTSKRESCIILVMESPIPNDRRSK